MDYNNNEGEQKYAQQNDNFNISCLISKLHRKSFSDGSLIIAQASNKKDAKQNETRPGPRLSRGLYGCVCMNTQKFMTSGKARPLPLDD